MRLRPIPLALVILLAGVSASTAQSRAGQPTTAGGTQTGTPSPQSGAQNRDEAPQRDVALDPTDVLANQPGWNLLLSAFGGHDNAKWNASGVANQDPIMNGGNAGGAIRVVGFGSSRKARYIIDGTTSTVYYPSASSSWTDSNLKLGGIWQLGQHTEISSVHNLTYAPYYGIDLFPTLGSYSGSDLASAYVAPANTGAQTAQVFRYAMDVRARHTVSDSAEIEAHYNLRRNDVSRASSASYEKEIGGRYQKKLNRALGYHLGYDYRTLAYEDTRRAQMNVIDIGLDFDRALSFSRRTIVRLTSATAFVTGRPIDATQSDLERTSFRLFGSAGLKHYLGRTWVVDASYVRDAQILDGLSAPYFTDGFSAGLSGRPGARTTTGVGLAYVSGLALSNSPRDRDRALVLSAWAQRRLSSKVTTYARVGSYRQRFNYDQLDAIGLAGRLSRISVRVGLNVEYHRNRATR